MIPPRSKPAPESAGGGSATKPVVDPVRVLVVDDAIVIRGMISRMLQADEGVEVVATASDGKRALELLDRHPIDVVVLDIEMPVMDGLEALPKIVADHPGVQVVMASTLTQRNAEISLKAMALGAADYLAKPASSGELRSADEFRADLVDKIRTLGKVAKRRMGRVRPGADAMPRTRSAVPVQTAEIKLRRMPAGFRPAAIAIGSSTGGPQALFKVLADLGAVDQPVFITQHMPATFTRILADHITRATGRPCEEASDGTPVKPGAVYVAAGGKHMVVEKRAGGAVIRLDDGPPENFCKPSVEPMLRSLAKAYDGKVLCAILTGMGSDGAKGAEGIADGGGVVLAQDEATSVVWGMPGATANRGAATQVLAVGEIGRAMRKIATGGRG